VSRSLPHDIRHSSFQSDTNQIKNFHEDTGLSGSSGELSQGQSSPGWIILDRTGTQAPDGALVWYDGSFWIQCISFTNHCRCCL